MTDELIKNKLAMISTITEQPNVHVSLTSISQRLDTLADTISSLLNQDYPNFRVTLYLSKEPYLLDEGVIGDLPDNLKSLV